MLLLLLLLLPYEGVERDLCAARLLATRRVPRSDNDGRRRPVDGRDRPPPDRARGRGIHGVGERRGDGRRRRLAGRRQAGPPRESRLLSLSQSRKNSLHRINIQIQASAFIVLVHATPKSKPLAVPATGRARLVVLFFGLCFTAKMSGHGMKFRNVFLSDSANYKM